jgi:hypothetical protein
VPPPFARGVRVGGLALRVLRARTRRAKKNKGVKPPFVLRDAEAEAAQRTAAWQQRWSDAREGGEDEGNRGAHVASLLATVHRVARSRRP